MARVSSFWKKIGDTIEPVFAGGVNILIRGTNRYLNFGSEEGVDGYGFRDNGGTIEYKSSGGSWAAVGSGGGGGGISDGDKGDITVSGSGTVWTVDNGVITLAKLQAAVQTSLGLADSATQPGDLATVATTGAYSDLSGTPDLSVYDNFEPYTNEADFPATGDANVIYLETSSGTMFRWTGAAYATISAQLALGETSATAYRGDRGKTAFDHTSLTNNPHSVTKTQIGLGSVPNTDFTAAVAANTSKLSATAPNIEDAITGQSADTLTDTSVVPFVKAATLVKVTWLNVKATLKTYFDTLYLPLAGGTMTGDITLGENVIVYDETLSGDETYTGIATPGVLGGTVATGDVVYLASDGDWEIVDGILDGTDVGFDKQLGICLDGGVATDATTILLHGKIRSATLPALTAGSAVYLSDTAGDLVVAQPSTTNFAIRIVGYAVTAEDLFFNPSPDYIVHI